MYKELRHLQPKERNIDRENMAEANIESRKVVGDIESDVG